MCKEKMVMIEGYEVPFNYRRKKPYKNLQGQRVNITYYPELVPEWGLR